MSPPTWIGSRHDACHIEQRLLLVSPVAVRRGAAMWLNSGRVVRRLIAASGLMIVVMMTLIKIFWP